MQAFFASSSPEQRPACLYPYAAEKPYAVAKPSAGIPLSYRREPLGWPITERASTTPRPVQSSRVVKKSDYLDHYHRSQGVSAGWTSRQAQGFVVHLTTWNESVMVSP